MSVATDAMVAANFRHGHAKKNGRTSEYNSWAAMHNRCRNPSHRDYASYGGRGIKVCQRWTDGDGELSGFECFLLDMSKKPEPSFSIERIENSRGYEPENCVWASQYAQVYNRRCTVRVEGKTLREIADEHGISYAMVRGRFYKGHQTIPDLTRTPNPKHLWANNGRCDVIDTRTGEIV